jgi:hypothetical protein
MLPTAEDLGQEGRQRVAIEVRGKTAGDHQAVRQGNQSPGHPIECRGARNNFVGRGVLGDELGSGRGAELGFPLVGPGLLGRVVPNVEIRIRRLCGRVACGRRHYWAGRLRSRKAEEQIGNVVVNSDLPMQFGGLFLPCQKRRCDNF